MKGTSVSQDGKRSRGTVYPLVKRAIDFTHSLLGLVALTPVLLFLALVVKFSSRGPILFRQERVGYRGRPFHLYKFRTMRMGAELAGPMVTSAGDPRVTPVGKYLRRYKLDELPQLFNVLMGDMSIVGPRPQTKGYFDAHREDYVAILDVVRPGITDFATLHFRDEEAALARHPDPERAYIEEFIPAKISLQHEYVRRMSLLTDLGIVLETLRAIVHLDSGTNRYAPTTAVNAPAPVTISSESSSKVA